MSSIYGTGKAKHVHVYMFILLQLEVGGGNTVENFQYCYLSNICSLRIFYGEILKAIHSSTDLKTSWPSHQSNEGLKQEYLPPIEPVLSFRLHLTIFAPITCIYPFLQFTLLPFSSLCIPPHTSHHDNPRVFSACPSSLCHLHLQQHKPRDHVHAPPNLPRSTNAELHS